MSEFKFFCPKCNQKMSAADEWAGMKTQCPKCGIELIIPSPTDTEVAEVVEEDELAEEPKRNPITLKDNKTMPKAETKPVESKPVEKEKDMVVVNAKRFLTSCFVVLLIVLAFWLYRMTVCGYFGYTCKTEEVQTLWEEAFHKQLMRFPYMMGFAILYYFCKNLFDVLLGIYKNTKKAE